MKTKTENLSVYGLNKRKAWLEAEVCLHCAYLNSKYCPHQQGYKGWRDDLNLHDRAVFKCDKFRRAGRVNEDIKDIKMELAFRKLAGDSD